MAFGLTLAGFKRYFKINYINNNKKNYNLHLHVHHHHQLCIYGLRPHPCGFKTLYLQLQLDKYQDQLHQEQLKKLRQLWPSASPLRVSNLSSLQLQVQLQNYQDHQHQDISFGHTLAGFKNLLSTTTTTATSRSSTLTMAFGLTLAGFKHL